GGCEVEFGVAFQGVDTVRLRVGFRDGKGEDRSEFWVDDFDLVRIPDPADRAVKPAAKGEKPVVPSALVPLGGRWYYDPKGGDREPPKQFDRTNADRLPYLAGPPTRRAGHGSPRPGRPLRGRGPLRAGQRRDLLHGQAPRPAGPQPAEPPDGSVPRPHACHRRQPQLDPREGRDLLPAAGTGRGPGPL